MKKFTTADFSAITNDQFAEDVRFQVVARGAHNKQDWETFSAQAAKRLEVALIKHDTLTSAAYKVAGIEQSLFVDDEEALKDSALLPGILGLEAEIASARYEIKVLEEVGYNQGHATDTREKDWKRAELAEWIDDQRVTL